MKSKNISTSVFVNLLILVLINISTYSQVRENISGAYYEGGRYHQQMEERSPFAGIDWISIGPSFQGGRVETLDCPIDQPGVIYAGFGAGSLWLTVNQGVDWNCIFEDELTQSIGDLAISVSNPDVLYLGTGESMRASRGFSLPGTGIYKSTDGGKTWYNKGLTDSHHIGRVVVDPTDHNIVFVAAIGHFWSKNNQRGLFMTMDGGQSWKNILFISDSTAVVDVAWDPANRILYAATWDMLAGENSGIYKSENLGYKWDRIDKGFPTDKGIGRIGLAISPSRPEVVYALVDNRNQIKTDSNKSLIGAEVYRSNDYGVNWKKTHTETLLNYSGFGWAFGDIRISPFDSNDIYILGIYLMHSSNGGKTFSRIGGSIHHIKPNSGQSLHLDQHDLYIDPLHPNYLILGNNGGVYLSYNKGESWTHCNTIPTGEFYDISIVDEDPVRVYGGTQDNSSIMGLIDPEDPYKTENSWRYVWLDPWSGGDGFSTLESPKNPNLVYYESQNGYLSLKNMLSGKTKQIKPKPDVDENPLRNSWFTPFFISQHDNETIYYGANKVYKSIDDGESWIRLSPDLCYSEKGERKSRSITALAESPIIAGLLFSGTEKGIVWVSRNDGTSWIEISKGIPSKKIIKLIPSRHKSSRIFLVAKGMDDDDYSPYIYISDNLGKSWSGIETNLPYESINCMLEDPVLNDLIYIGTDRGVYCSPNLGYNWESVSKTLPTTSVHQLEFMKNNKYLLAATHGMSLFTAFTEPIRIYYANSLGKQPFFMASIDGKIPQQNDYNGDWDLTTTRELHLSYNWPKREEIKLSLIDEKKDLVYVENLYSSEGINQWRWNLIIEEKPDNTIYPIPEIIFPEPGYYTIIIEGPSGQIQGPVRIY